MSAVLSGNLFDKLPLRSAQELLEVLVERKGVRIERVVSTGQASPAGFWYDQPDDEFVLLLAGSAVLRFAEGNRQVVMQPGDWIEIPAHVRHRVEQTDAERPTVWLAVHRRVS
ncbi:MAG: cupin domain-containing protein [Alphaproteobacteria bacterium]|nr:cupin domain-containing protein [Alphaproteobacteria bacterium]